MIGLYDGSDGQSDRGSTVEISRLLRLPVVLVIDASAMARSAAAVVDGFATFDARVEMAGVILNRVGGRHHAGNDHLVHTRQSPEDGHVSGDRVPDHVERHLGLHLPHEAH